MPQKPRPLTPGRDALSFFGAELRHWRERAGVSQTALGTAVHVSRDTIAKVEKAQRWPPPGLAARCDAILQTGGVLERLTPLVDQHRERERGRAVALAPGQARTKAVDDPVGLGAVARARWPGTRVVPVAASPGRMVYDVRLPAGTHFAATSVLTALKTSARMEMDRSELVADETWMPQPRLLVTPASTGDSLRFYAQDLGGRVCTPTEPTISAYELDDFTYAGLWAVISLEAALLSDDAKLAETFRRAARQRWKDQSGVARSELEDLAPVSQMWLGSMFCADHILRHLDALLKTPTFWTREQRGEEASTWLLFRHKLAYLRRTSNRYANDPAQAVRIFCIPEATVTASSTAERILLLLAATLMEAYQIEVQIVVDLSYSDVPGFVNAGSGPSIIATWVRGEDAWHADVTTRPAARRHFTDAARAAAATSLVQASAPLARLERMAHYLGLDWRWIRTRATEIAATGWSGLIRPRSRHLSVDGLDTACRFLAGGSREATPLSYRSQQ
ncbi:MAG: helix-turn-helix domain-containing protein [Kineosporiaceae bacterium]